MPLFQIHVRWSAKLWMRDPALGLDTFADGAPAVLHFDGVSVYDLTDIGMVKAHRIEKMLLSGGEHALDSLKLVNLVPSMGCPQACPRCGFVASTVCYVPMRMLEIDVHSSNGFDEPTSTGRPMR